MTVDGTAVIEIAALEAAKTKTVVIDGRTYSDYNLKPVYYDPRPDAMSFVSLSAAVEYLKSDIESVKGRKLFFVVENIDKVGLVEAFSGESQRRTVFATISPVKLDGFPFGQFMDLESMVIKTKALFIPNPDLDEIIKYLSTVSKDSSVTTGDDGVAQTLSVRVGVKGALTERAETKGIYSLQARRIFPEVTQPISDFIFRVRSGDEKVTAALFEADGGAWRITAIQNIRAWIESQELGIPVLG